MSGPRASQLACPEAAGLEQREARIERGLQALNLSPQARARAKGRLAAVAATRSRG